VSRENSFWVRATAVMPGYFETMGIPLLAGRDILASDTEAVPHVVVINERTAEQAWPGEPPLSAIGRVFYGGGVGTANPAVVVGVVPTGRHITLGEDPMPVVYTSLEQMGRVPVATLFYRTAGNPVALLDDVSERIRSIDARVVLHDAEPASALVERALFAPRASASLLTAFAFLGLLLAALGVYGVVSNSVNERTREMGVRIALGAGGLRVQSAVVGRVLLVVVLGAGLGLIAALTGGRLVTHLLYDVPARDPITLVAVAATLLATAFTAAWIPARRATRLDPMKVLRAD
jgi:hypothetical protein